VINIGDSRAISSLAPGNITSITTDHKPDLITESIRILSNGGKILREEVTSAGRIEHFASNSRQLRKLTSLASKSNYFGPSRVIPGHLSVQSS